MHLANLADTVNQENLYKLEEDAKVKQTSEHSTIGDLRRENSELCKHLAWLKMKLNDLRQDQRTYIDQINAIHKDAANMCGEDGREAYQHPYDEVQAGIDDIEEMRKDD